MSYLSDEVPGYRIVGEREFATISDAQRAADGLFLVGYRVRIKPRQFSPIFEKTYIITWYEREAVRA